MSEQKTFDTPVALSQAIKLLDRHKDELYHAIKHDGGMMHADAVFERSFAKLRQAGLVYVADELDGYVVHGVVARFIRHFDERGRLTQNSLDITRILSGIEQSMEYHRMTSRRSDDKRFFDEVLDGIAELCEVLLTICHQFTVQIYEYMASIRDIETRIRFNQAQIAELSRLNDIVGRQLSLPALGQMGLMSDEFDKLCQSMLLPIVDKCRRELVVAAAKLNDELLRFKKEQACQQIDRLIYAWRQHFRQFPNFCLDDGLLSTLPRVFYRVDMKLVAYANWDGVDYDDYVDIAKKCTAIPTMPNPVPDDVLSVAQTVNESIDEQVSPVLQRVQWLFEYAEQAGSMDARTAFDVLGVGQYVGMDDWLLTVAMYHRSYWHDLDIVFDGEPMTGYNGTQLVYNVVLSA